MRVLLSAYACEPDKGSEPGVGWNWAIEIARRGHDVTVLTRANNRPSIEAAVTKAYDFPSTVEFAYYELPAWARSLKRRTKSVLPYYALWQWGAYRIALSLHERKKFDLAHHITFGGIRHFSFMWRLEIPFFLGPIGGGETSPFWLRWHTGWRGTVVDTARDLANALASFDPIGRAACRRASVVYFKTPDTARLFFAEGANKAQCQLEIGINHVADELPDARTEERSKRVLYVGRFLHWKGMSIGLESFAAAAKTDPSLSLTMVGRGPAEKRWRELAERFDITAKVAWIPWLPSSKLREIYASHGLLLFPSLHDSSGNVVLEALSYGLPIVCLKLGGPGIIVDESCGHAIPVDHKDYKRLIDEMADAILSLSGSAEVWTKASLRARAATAKWSWAERVEALGVY